MPRDLTRLPDPVAARLQVAGITPGVVVRGVRTEHVVSRIELRDAQAVADTMRVVGYATSWEQGYDVYGGPSAWGWTEVMAAGSWDKTLAEADDIRALVNHEGVPVARTKSSTLQLTADDVGLLVDMTLDLRSPTVASLGSAIERGDIDQMSCAFQVLRQEWSPDWMTRRILEVKGFDVSIVTYPANEATLVIGRDAQREPAERRLAVDAARRRLSIDEARRTLAA